MASLPERRRQDHVLDIPDAAQLADDLANDVYREVQRRVEQLVAEIG